MRGAVTGVNAAVVGLLAAALCNRVWVTAVHSATDVAIVLAALLLLVRGALPPLAIVILCVLGSMTGWLRG